ncbi:MAG TPA: hypothetical protein VIK93_03715 [Limnochordales bacterium]
MTSSRGWLRNMLIATGALAATGWAAYRLAERRLRPDQPQLALARGHRLLRQSRRVLVATGRWDDLEFLIGGTLRLLAQAGADIAIAGPGPVPVNPTWRELAVPHALVPEELATDQTYSPAVQKAVKRLWAELEPDAVLTFDADFPARFLRHPAHELVGHAVIDLVLADAVPRAELLAFGTRRANVLVDVGPVLPAKLRALAAPAGAPGADRFLGRGGTLERVGRRAPRLYAQVWGHLYGHAAGIACGEAFRAVQPHTAPVGHGDHARTAFDGLQADAHARTGSGHDLYPL